MKRLSAGLLVVAALLTGACGSKKLVVGVVLPETGPNNGYGASLKAGIKLAFDDAVAKQSPKGIEARYRDSFSSPEAARKESEDLYKVGALIVIGGATSAEAKWMIPEADKANKVLISPSASEPGLAASSNLFFRVCPGDDIEGVVAADFVVSQRKARTILVLYQKGLFGEAMLKVFTDEATKLGAKITAELLDRPHRLGAADRRGARDRQAGCRLHLRVREETLAALQVVRNRQVPGARLRQLGLRHRWRAPAGRGARRRGLPSRW